MYMYMYIIIYMYINCIYRKGIQISAIEYVRAYDRRWIHYQPDKELL